MFSTQMIPKKHNSDNRENYKAGFDYDDINESSTLCNCSKSARTSFPFATLRVDTGSA